MEPTGMVTAWAKGQGTAVHAPSLGARAREHGSRGCRRNSLSASRGCSACKEALFPAAPIAAGDQNPLHAPRSPIPQSHRGCCGTASCWLRRAGARIRGAAEPRAPPADWPGPRRVTLEGGQADVGDSGTSQAPAQAPISHRKQNGQEGAPGSPAKALRAQEVTNSALSQSCNML